MPISVQCPKCGTKLKAPEKLAGKKAKCACGHVVSVPGTAQAARAPAATPMTAAPSSARSTAPSQAASSPAPRWRPLMGTICPNCQAKMEAGAVLCTACGFHTEKGIVLAPPSVIAAAKAREAEAAKPEAKKTVVAAADAGFAGFVGRMIKPAIILVLLALAGFGVYATIAFVRHDPEAEGKARVAKLARGMTVEQVVQIVGKPAHVYVFRSDHGDGGLLGGMARQAQIDYVDDFMKAHGKEKLAEGFYFVYTFSAAGATHVSFGGDGKLIGTQDVPNLLRR